MLNIKDVKIDVNKTLGSRYLLTSVKPKFNYVNGERTDTISSFSYEIVLVDRLYERISVKIEGPNQISEEKLIGAAEVTFRDLEMYIYYSQGEYHVAARASAIQLLNKVEKS